MAAARLLMSLGLLDRFGSRTVRHDERGSISVRIKPDPLPPSTYLPHGIEFSNGSERENDEADRLAGELAGMTGESITEAIVVALRERLQRHRSQAALTPRLRRLVAEVADYPVLDPRTADEILDYDERGLPAWSGLVVDTSAAVAILTGKPTGDTHRCPRPTPSHA